MTVKELIEKLEDIKPSSTEVLMNDTEGWTKIDEVRIVGGSVIIERGETVYS